MWTTVDYVEQRHKEKFHQSRLSRSNIEHAMKQMFGYTKVLNENVSELMIELARRESVLEKFESLETNTKSVSIDDARGLILAERGSLYRFGVSNMKGNYHSK